MKARALLIVLALAASPALAQDRPESAPYGTQQGFAGQAQQSSEYRDRASEPADKAKPKHWSAQRHPGTLKKFNTGSAGAPQVQFDVDRLEAKEAAKNR